MITAKEAEQWALKQPIFKNLKDYLERKVTISSNWEVAEFGIGKWGFGRFYKQMVKSVVGIDVEDYSPFNVDVNFVLSNGRDIPLADKSIDMVVSHSALEHVADLDRSISEINRIARHGAVFFLTVTPLYYSGYGAHLRENGKRLEDWEHLDPSSRHYLTATPLPGARTVGHSLNKLTSSKFLAAVGKQPWSIISYDIALETKPVPQHVDRSQCADVDLLVRGFRFVGRKEG